MNSNITLLFIDEFSGEPEKEGTEFYRKDWWPVGWSKKGKFRI